MQETSFAVGVRYPTNEVAVLDIEGDLTSASEEALSNAYSEIEGGIVRVVVLNFNALDYMNSSGIGLLVTLLVRINRHNQRLVATGLNEHYLQIFEVTRLSEAIGIFETEADAIASA